MFGLRRGEFDKTYEAFLNCVHPEDRKSVTDAVDENGNVWNWGDIRGDLSEAALAMVASFLSKSGLSSSVVTLIHTSISMKIMHLVMTVRI